MFKVNNRNTRARREICSKLTTKIPERRDWRRSGIFIVNFEHISHLVSIVNFEQVNAWVSITLLLFLEMVKNESLAQCSSTNTRVVIIIFFMLLFLKFCPVPLSLCYCFCVGDCFEYFDLESITFFQLLMHAVANCKHFLIICSYN